MDTGKLIKSLTPEIRPHVRVIEPTVTPVHISDNPRIPVFTPRVPELYGRRENTSQPRICVSLSIIKALESKYDMFFGLFMSSQTFLTLYTFPQATQLIEVNNTVVEDAEVNQEHWIVRLDDHDVFIPKTVGKLDVAEIRLLTPVMTVWSLAIEVTEPLVLADTYVLETGWHLVQVKFVKDLRRKQSAFRFKELVQHRELTREQYYAVRQTHDLTQVKFEQDPRIAVW